MAGEQSNAAFITGGTGLLGRSLVETFAERDWLTLGGQRSRVSAEGMFALDLASDEQIANVVELIEPRLEGLSHLALVANASNRDCLKGTLGTLSRDQFHALFDVDVVGHFLLARGLFELTKRVGLSYSVVFVSSIYGGGGVHEGIYPEEMTPSPLHYSVAKSALFGLAKDLAGRWGGAGVRVNCIAAGGLEASQPAQFTAEYARLTPLGRLAAPGEVSHVAEVLSHPRSSYVTGQVVWVDGGWSAW